jgi:hypothetical protein
MRFQGGEPVHALLNFIYKTRECPDFIPDY